MARDFKQLLIALGLLVVAVVSITASLVSERVREAEHAALRRVLETRADLARELVGSRLDAPAPRAEIDALADRAGSAAGLRVTLVSPAGVVVGDSGIPFSRLGELDNYADRPEIRAALAGHRGEASRHSEATGRPLRYVALPVQAGKGGAVRVSTPATEALGASAGLWRDFGGSLAIGMLLAGGLAFALARSRRRPLQDLQRLTEGIANGELDHRLPAHGDAELGGLAASIQRLAEQLREKLGEATAEKERLRAVLDGMREGVLVIDPAGEIVLANDRIQDFFGLERSLEGGTVLERIRNADLAELLGTASRGSEPIARAIAVSHPTPRTFRVHAVRFPAGAEQPVGTVAVIHDITDLTRLETMRRDFVANASHELRTPLAAIRGFAETLLKSPELPDHERKDYLEVIDRNAKRLANLVADLLALSRIESGKNAIACAAVDVGTLTESLLRENQARFRDRGLEVSYHVEGEPAARADPSAVEQVLTNLLDNAIQYTERGGTIRVSIDGSRDELRVTVRDTGIGIPEADLARIFERFYRVDQARSRALGGTGLGLAIVKHLLQKMHGEISVESRLGEGSRFTFTLPRS